MLTQSNNSEIIYCTFPPTVLTKKFYSCYKKEICCEEGCCVAAPYHIYQVWYNWLIFLVILGIISGLSWFCRKSRMPSNVRRNTSTNSWCYRRRGSPEQGRATNLSHNTNSVRQNEEGVALDRLHVSYGNRSARNDPPSYSSILSPHNPRMAPLYNCYGPPPTYNSMYKTQETDFSEGPALIQVHCEDSNRNEVSSAAERIGGKVLKH